MALTYLDSVMIENPAYFQQLSAAQLSAHLFRNSGDIFTVGLSVQRLSADIASFNDISFNNIDLSHAKKKISKSVMFQTMVLTM